MKAQHFVDEDVLADLLKNDPEGAAWKTMFRHYREPFVRHFESHGCPAEKGQPLFREMFALLVTGIREGMIKAPFEHTLFEHLVALGENRLAGQQASGAEIPPNMPAQSKQPFLAGETLLLLLSASHEATLNAIYKHYREPVFAMLKSQFRLCDDVLYETYSESVAILNDNIRQGRLELPMTARLFTYFFRVMRNRSLELDKKRLPPMPGTAQEIERELSQIPEEDPEPDVEEKFPFPPGVWESLVSMLEPEDDLFKHLIASLDPLSREILRLHFVEGLRYKEIGKRVNLSESTARKRVFDSVKKLKRRFMPKNRNV